jgi:hypothetical protein
VISRNNSEHLPRYRANDISPTLQTRDDEGPDLFRHVIYHQHGIVKLMPVEYCDQPIRS